MAIGKTPALACAAAFALLPAAAFGQAAGSDAEPGAQSAPAAPGADPFESELDRLSRSVDDPFADLEINETREPVSVTLRALNKITARYVDIEAPMEEIAAFGTLEIVPRFCDKRPPEEFPETTAFLQIYDLGVTDEQAEAMDADGGDGGAAASSGDGPAVDASVVKASAEALFAEDDAASGAASGAASEAANTGAEGRTAGWGPPPVDEGSATDPLGDLSEGAKIFSGWMFASSPALNALEHPVYDIWVIDCKTVRVDK